MKNEIVIRDELWGRLCHIGNSKVLRVVLFVLREKLVTRVEIAEELDFAPNSIESLMLQSNGLIRKCIDQHNRKQYYFPSMKIVPELKCVTCKYGVKDGIWKCKSKRHCIYDFDRRIHGLNKTLSKDPKIKMVKLQKNVKGKGTQEAEDVGKADLREWNRADFVKQFVKEYEVFDHLIKMKKSVIKKWSGKLCTAFEVEFEEWQFMLRNYIRFTFKEAVNKEYVPSLKQMCERDAIQDFVDKNRKLLKAGWCSQKGLFCIYCVGGKCTFEDCTQELRNKLKDNYN